MCGEFEFFTEPPMPEYESLWFTYFDSLNELWSYGDGFEQYGEWTHHGGWQAARAMVALLFIFSFVWPHVKLLILHLHYYLPLTKKRRVNGMYWSAVFGKWSFADVLTMSALIGVFNLVLNL